MNTNSATLKSATDVPMIQIRGLTKSYGDHPVLKGIDFEVDASQVVVVIGPSGSGKSCLLYTSDAADE